METALFFTLFTLRIGRKLLTLHVINRMLINQLKSYPSTSGHVDNRWQIVERRLISEKANFRLKSYHCYQHPLLFLLK